MHDESQIQADARGPEITVFGFIDAMKLQARLGGIHLQIEGCGFNGLLLFSGQAGETIRKCIGDPEFHGFIVCQKFGPAAELPLGEALRYYPIAGAISSPVV